MVFDLIEGSREYFHRDQVTFMREYTREQAAELVAAAGLGLVAFDRVDHAPGGPGSSWSPSGRPPQS